MPNPPFNYALEQEQLKRKQALYDNLTQSLMQQKQGQMIGNRYVGPGAVDAIGKVLQAYLVSKGEKDLQGEKTKLQEDYNANLKSGMEGYFATRQGTPETIKPYSLDQTRNLLENDQAYPPEEIQPAVKGDPRRAAIEAVSSSFPQLQQLGMHELTQLDKGQVSVKDLLPHASASAIPAMLQEGVGAFKGKSDLGTVGDVIYDKDTKQKVQLGGAPGAQQTINGDLYQESPSTGALRKLDNAPKVSVGITNSPVIAGQKKGVEAYFTHAAAKVDDLGKQAAASGQLLSTLDTLKQLHKAGISGGVTSEMATNAANLAQSMGLKVDTARLGNTEAYNSLITDLWQRSVSQYGGNRGVTAPEAEEIKKLAPMAKFSPQAREQLFALQEGVARRNIEMYKQANKSFAEAAAADDPRLFKIPDHMEATYVPAAASTPNPSFIAN